ncbi:hypothetical protein PQJ75_27275 [Rhodoplanes sp. TEM]|uniref:Transmembrane protein n=1 Tax=Rhodoplanes tepidamans TaxID=200616 RepID=A0ABT5JAV7_RHOTP|nr:MULTISPECIES: hypothetical protein [Rhodoplanes]MDC7786782.1 hypothetical protein [Rhodoplanes tepidamans]MDC7987452.1 hypothetical protein [Rhodoplanes sp. TEM]MDQ0356338.1 hypothetical protein [Rhodoplanes tepidamans]
MLEISLNVAYDMIWFVNSVVSVGSSGFWFWSWVVISVRKSSVSSELLLDVELLVVLVVLEVVDVAVTLVMMCLDRCRRRQAARPLMPVAMSDVIDVHQ